MPSNCPFCGSKDIEFEDLLESMVCNFCGAEGPTADDEDQALTLWEKRAD